MPSVDNPIGALQELSQARGGQPAPVYVLQDVCGESHCPHFTYEASWADLRAVGEGSSKVRLQLSGCSQNIQLQKEARHMSTKGEPNQMGVVVDVPKLQVDSLDEQGHLVVR